MATYPIFSQEGGQRIAINPNSVTSIVEIEPKLVLVCLPDGGSANIAMSLEDVVARLMGKLRLTVNEEKTRVCKVPESEFDFLGYTFGRMYSARTNPSARRKPIS